MNGKRIIGSTIAAAAAVSIMVVPAKAAPVAGGGSETVTATGTGVVEPEVYPSSVGGSWRNRTKKFAGKVTSTFTVTHDDAQASENVCTADRRVELFKVRSDRPNKSLGVDRTDESGRWAISARSDRGNHYVKVKGEQFLYREYYGIQYYGVCAATRSKV